LKEKSWSCPLRNHCKETNQGHPRLWSAANVGINATFPGPACEHRHNARRTAQMTHDRWGAVPCLAMGARRAAKPRRFSDFSKKKDVLARCPFGGQGYLPDATSCGCRRNRPSRVEMRSRNPRSTAPQGPASSKTSPAPQCGTHKNPISGHGIKYTDAKRFEEIGFNRRVKGRHEERNRGNQGQGKKQTQQAAAASQGGVSWHTPHSTYYVQYRPLRIQTVWSGPSAG